MITTEIILLFSLFINGIKQLDEQDRVKQVEYNRLEVEKIRIARKAVDPGDPHEEGVLKGVDEAENDDNLAFYVVEEEAEVETKGENLEIHIK